MVEELLLNLPSELLLVSDEIVLGKGLLFEKSLDEESLFELVG